MKRLLFAFLLFAFYFSPAQTDSCGIRISLLTCTPGQELYSTFGHSAFRVVDSTNNADLVFNYGTFDFYDPEFYNKFVKGKLLYFVSIDTLPSFLAEYEYYKRGITEQAINISCEDNQKLLAALFENAKDENKYYRYDFLFDNCTTRAGRIVEKNTNTPVQFKNILPSNPPSFRNLIHEYLDKGEQHWSKLGIDILLGAKLDRKSTNEEAIHFLPDYLLRGFENAAVNKLPLAAPAKRILDPNPVTKINSLFKPLVVFSLLLLIGILLSLGKKRKWNLVNGIFDFLFFFILGLAGLLLLFMWFGTDHTVTQNNYNLVWALPLHVIMAFFVHSNKTWVKTYFKIVFWISLLLVLTWFFLPQQMNNALIPVVLLIIFRSWGLSKIKNYGTERDIT